MAIFPGNEQLRDSAGRLLGTLHEINLLDPGPRESIYHQLIPPRLYRFLGLPQGACRGINGKSEIRFISPQGLGILRIEARLDPTDHDTVFFVELADTHFRQMELSFCVISDPRAERFNVDCDSAGRDNCFATLGRNVPEEMRAMRAGLFPNQTRRGLRLFGEFFPLLERFVDALGMEMIVAEPLTYDNAIRYEKYGFDYTTGKRLMMEIDAGFRTGGVLFDRLDGSTPFRTSGLEKTVRGRSWAIHDGVLDEPWDGIRIYKMVGRDAGINTFPGRETEEVEPLK